MPYTKEERETMIRLWKEGVSFDDIGETIGRTKKAVQKQIREYREKQNPVCPDHILNQRRYF